MRNDHYYFELNLLIKMVVIGKTAQQHLHHCQYFAFSQVTDKSYTYAHFSVSSNQTNLLQWGMDNLKFIVFSLICVDRQKYHTYWYSEVISLNIINQRLWPSGCHLRNRNSQKTPRDKNNLSCFFLNLLFY